MSRRSASFALLLLLVIGGGAGCRAPVRNYECDGVTASDPWRCNLRIVERAARGKRFSLRQFEAAHAFFLERTAIDLSHRPTPQGLLPGPNLKRDLRRLRQWAADHGED